MHLSLMNLDELLKNLNIEENKKSEIYKKKNLQDNLITIYTKYKPGNRLLYTLACTAPKNINLLMLADLIGKNIIKNESTLRAVYKKIAKDKKIDSENLRMYIIDNDKGLDEINTIIKSACLEQDTKKNILIKLKNALPFADSKYVLDLVNNYKKEDEVAGKSKGDWLDEGEISKLHKPGENPQINDMILQEHLKKTDGRVVTRFPPEPNGVLHIGHAKAINLDFEYAKKYGGITFLRFDDTNPRKEDECYFDSIIEDVKWLGFSPCKITASSDYFDEMINFGRVLIAKNKAYICELSVDEIKKRRKMYTEALEKDNTQNKDELALILSPYRNRNTEESLAIYEGMVNKKYKEGDYTLRFKMDLPTKNPLMLDLVGMRIIDCDHVRTKDKYNLYPTYEFALCVSDSLENVTHSFCTREFFTRQESYNWLLEALEIYKPVQWEFGRLNLSHTVVSKRKLVPLRKFNIELDDPRLYTIKGMRRRGIPAVAINNFVKSVGITYADTIIDCKVFESFIRDELNRTSRRVMCVVNPLKVFIRNSTHSLLKASDNCENGIEREIVFSPYIYIEKTDFDNNPDSSFLRFAPNQPVGLYLFGAIKFVDYKDGMIIAETTTETPKKFIHWVDVNSCKVELRIYDKLFLTSNPNDGEYTEHINHNSLQIKTAYCDKRIAGCSPGDRLQFQRIGYFCVDKDSTNDKMILNQTIELK